MEEKKGGRREYRREVERESSEVIRLASTTIAESQRSPVASRWSFDNECKTFQRKRRVRGKGR